MSTKFNTGRVTDMSRREMLRRGLYGAGGALLADRMVTRALADAIADILSEPARAARMGQAARARVERLFQWDQAAAELVSVFEETIRAAHGRPRAA